MTHPLEALLVRGLASGIRSMSWPGSLGFGAGLGDLARHLGLRRQVAESNLALAFPDKSGGERARILVEHYRELGRVACEYPRLGELVRAAGTKVVAEVIGLEHLERARAAGRGAILLTGHYGNFELLGAWLGRLNPVSFMVKPLSNRKVEALLGGWREAAGVGQIPVGVGVRRAFAALRQNRWLAMLADQDARGDGVFVPFLGRPASTPSGPAHIALRTGAPIIMGFGTRLGDGRHRLTVEPPIEVDADGPEAAVRLTAAHTAVLERWVRRHPEMWFWLHKRWKTSPPATTEKGTT